MWLINKILIDELEMNGLVFITKSSSDWVLMGDTFHFYFRTIESNLIIYNTNY